MKPWTDLDSIPTPHRIALLPKDERGYPIPTSVYVKDGKHDFRVLDPHKWAYHASRRLCGLCGEVFGQYVCFVGGGKSIDARLFTDLGMHRDCARYALMVCPFLAAPSFGYRKSVDETEFEVNHNVSTERPKSFGLGVTKRYSVARLNDNYLLHPEAFTQVTWWRNGVEYIAQSIAEAE